MQKISLIIFFIFSLNSNVLNSMQQSTPLYDFAINKNVTLLSDDYIDEQTKIILAHLLQGPEFLQEKKYHKFYTILGISPNTSSFDIPHISKFAHLTAQNINTAAQVMLAHRILTNEKLRSTYDLFDLEGLFMLAQQYKQDRERQGHKRSRENKRTIQENICYKKARKLFDEFCSKQDNDKNNGLSEKNQNVERIVNQQELKLVPNGLSQSSDNNQQLNFDNTNEQELFRQSLSWVKKTKDERIDSTLRCQFLKCNKLFDQSEEFVAHIATHKPNNMYKIICDQCGKGLKERHDLERHINFHIETAKKAFICSVCKKGFVRPTNLIKHYNVQHQRNSWSCNFLNCNMPCSSQRALLDHIKHMHDKDGDLVCYRCGMLCENKRALIEHNHTHVE